MSTQNSGNKDLADHYSFGGLRERIEHGLSTLSQPPTVASLGAVDEFHVGGRPATAHLVEQLALGPADRVLDIGSGLGGTGRYIASSTGAAVVGVDVTEEYVHVARWLTELVGLSALVKYVLIRISMASSQSTLASLSCFAKTSLLSSLLGSFSEALY